LPLWAKGREKRPNSPLVIRVVRRAGNALGCAASGGPRAISAVVAQQLYTLWVGGSNPSSPTRFRGLFRWRETEEQFMNKCIHLLVVLVMAGAASARADLLIYQYRTVNTAAGNSTEFTYSYRGYLIWDLASNHLSWVSYSVQGSTRRYSLTEGTPNVAT